MLTWSLAIRNLKRRKLRTGLTASGIVVGISMMLILLSLVSGMEAQTRSMVRAMGGADITISNGTMPAREGMGGFFGVVRTLNESLTQIISQIPGVYAISPQLSFSGNIGGARTTIYGINPASYMAVTGGLNIVSGSFLSESSKNEIVLGRALMDSLNLTLGQDVNLEVSQGEGKAFRIIGIFETGIVFQEYAGYITLADAQNITGQNDLVTQILVKCEDPSLVSDVSSLISSSISGVRVSSPTTVVQQASQMLNTLTMFFATIGLVALFAGSFGIINTMIMSVTERTREIGILKAIGAKNSDIMKMFLAEALLIGLMGGGFGVIIGSILTYVFPMLTSGLFSFGASPIGMGNPGFRGFRGAFSLNIAPAITPINIALCFSLGAIVGILAGLYPAWHASRMKPVEALRHA
jgi:putative ABC transport system permease protein